MFEIKIITTKHPFLTEGMLARDLYTTLSLAKNSKDYQRWFRTQSEMFTQGVDFIESRTSASTRIDHIISLDMAKHICLMSKTELGKAYRKALIEMEKSKTKELSLADQFIMQGNMMKEQERVAKVLETKAEQAQVNNHEDRLETMESVLFKTKRKIHRTNNCGDGFTNMSQFSSFLITHNNPIASSALYKIFNFYKVDITTTGNCFKHEDFLNVLKLVVNNAVKIGAFKLDEQSSIKFKADWF
jgi:phage anti-repressor protein